MIQLIVTIHEGREPDGKTALTTQSALLNIEPKTELELKSAEHLLTLFTAAMHQWHEHWREQGMVDEFTAIERDPQ